MSYDARLVKEKASQFGWLDILTSIAPSLEAATQRCGQHVPCPVNGGKDGFRLFKDAPISGAGYSNKEGAMGDGFAVLQFVTGLGFKQVLTLVANHLGLTQEKVLYVKPRAVPKQVEFTISYKEVLTRKSKLNSLWGQSNKIVQDDRVSKYMQSRNVQSQFVLNSTSIRLHPAAWYRDCNGNQASAPAMLLKFQSPDGTPCNIHKTFLSTNKVGKADIENPKIMMKPSCKMRGGAVRIGGIDAINNNNGLLHISEGFENAASIADIFQQPSWATLNWALLQGFEPPKEVKTLVIWADNDPLDERNNNAGVNAAKRLQARLAQARPDIKVFLKIPPNVREDWNDLYKMERLDLFSLEDL